jgi:DNA-3-methyladenine glycosylase II
MLTRDTLESSAHWLAARDPALARVLDRYGYPPLWDRAPGFATLVHIILEQQVSLASANAAFQRLTAQLGTVTPAALLALDDESLRAIGFSRQKTRYARALAEAVRAGALDFGQLATLSDDAVRSALTELPGIGHWTADIYLSECLLRPDILPKGDIAMQEAFRVLKNLPRRPTHDEFVAQTEHWRPWRSVASRLLWHWYLSERRPAS